MNSAEISEIKETWKVVQASPTDSGVAILAHFLTKYPSNLEKFPFFLGTPIPELKESARFRSHANRIIRVFEESIQTLGADAGATQLEDIWRNIAQTHFKRQIEKQSFNELKECVVDVLVPACKLNDTQIEAWSKLLDAVYDIIFHALDQLKDAAQAGQ